MTRRLGPVRVAISAYTRRLAAPAVVAAGLVTAAPAHAAPPWSDPVAVPNSRGPAALAFSTNGSGLVVGFGPGDFGRRYPGTTGARIEPSGSIGPIKLLARDFSVGGDPERVAPDPAGRVSVVGDRGSRSGARLAAAGGRLGGRLSRPRDIGLAEPIAPTVAADANARGDHAVLFQVSGRSTSFRRRSIYLVVRRAGRAFGRPVRVARGPGVASLDVAIGDGGQAVVAWARERRVGVRRVSSSGRLERSQTAGDHGRSGPLHVAVAPAGHAVVGWAAELDEPPRNPGADYGPYGIRAVLAPPGGAFAAARQLEVNDSGSMAVEPLGRDRFVLAYEGREGDRSVVRTADAGAPGIGSAQTVSDPGGDSFLADLATGPRGEALVSWLPREPEVGPVGRFHEIAAAVRGPSAESFSTPESVARMPEVSVSDLAIDPSSGRVVVVFDAGGGALRVVTRPRIEG